MSFKEFRLDILKQEIDLVEKRIQHFDGLRWQTRQITAILWTGVLGFALKEQLFIFLFIGALLPIPFWVIEANYRRFYRGFYWRSVAIRDFIRDGSYEVQGHCHASVEQFLSDDPKSIFPVPDYWAKATLKPERHEKETDFLKNFLHERMLIFYVPFIVTALGLALYFLLKT